MLGAPFQCSLFLVRGKNLLHEANCAGATYLFQQDKFYDVSWDTGDKSVQCGRKVKSQSNLILNLLENSINLFFYQTIRLMQLNYG